MFADLTTYLLGVYDVVIRTDTDEFLVVDPSVAPDLRAYLEKNDRPYCTARGFDVIQTMGERPLEPGPLLVQRKFAYPNSALNKTCIVRMPTRWSPGFHWCTVAPEFGAVFMIHLKRIDVERQQLWNSEISRHFIDNGNVPQYTRDHYAHEQIKILEYNLHVSMRPRLSGIQSWYREEHENRFLSSVRFDKRSGFYVGTYEHDNVLCEFPEPWRAVV